MNPDREAEVQSSRRDGEDRRNLAPEGRRKEDHKLRTVFYSWLPLVVGLLLVLMLVNAVLSGVLIHSVRVTDENTKTIKAGQVGGCKRTQDLRDTINFQAASQYRILTTFAHGGSGRISTFLGTVANRYVYLPPIDCSAQQDRPATYVPPAPIPFRQVAHCYDAVHNPRPLKPC